MMSGLEYNMYTRFVAEQALLDSLNFELIKAAHPNYYIGDMVHPLDSSESNTFMEMCDKKVSEILNEHYPLPYTDFMYAPIIPRGSSHSLIFSIYQLMIKQDPPRIPEVRYSEIPKIAFLLPSHDVTVGDISIIKHRISETIDAQNKEKLKRKGKRR